ncbi:hypothetical protein [Sulfitobacter indolifex]|uniref:hypothetical protein n=1 Tax=Sulfitobacter indolifex TaxID=225422 RepID=UPI001FADDA53|nr:hypothetical protein [Sulfitobacter indolifex]
MSLRIHAGGWLESPRQILDFTHAQALESVSEQTPISMWLSPKAEPVICPTSKIDRGQFDNAASFFTGPAKALKTTPPISGTEARNLPSPGVSRLLEDPFKELGWIQR